MEVEGACQNQNICLQGVTWCDTVLSNRHMRPSGQCPVCEKGAGDVMHVIFKCERATEVWKALGIWNLIEEAFLVDSGSCGS